MKHTLRQTIIFGLSEITVNITNQKKCEKRIMRSLVKGVRTPFFGRINNNVTLSGFWAHTLVVVRYKNIKQRFKSHHIAIVIARRQSRREDQMQISRIKLAKICTEH